MIRRSHPHGNPQCFVLRYLRSRYSCAGYHSCNSRPHGTRNVCREPDRSAGRFRVTRRIPTLRHKSLWKKNKWCYEKKQLRLTHRYTDGQNCPDTGCRPLTHRKEAGKPNVADRWSAIPSVTIAGSDGRYNGCMCCTSQSHLLTSAESRLTDLQSSYPIR